MIDLYSWPTPNGIKVHIMLEELGVPYRVHAVDIGAGDQFEPAYLALNPNNKIPTIVDSDGPDGGPYTVFESGAILIYLAEKSCRLLPAAAADRHTALQWLMFQMASVGPMLGQCHHFRHYAPSQIDYAIERYSAETSRIYGVLDRRLENVQYLASYYSIADIATWPWIRSHARQGQDLASFPNLARWFETIARRPAVEAGVQVLAERRTNLATDARAREVLFGKTQYERR